MTAIARIEPRTSVTSYEPSFGDLLDMGKNLVGTGFLPDHIKTGAQAAAIILAGRELGMQPMRALRSLVMVKGKVTEAADSQLSRFKADGGRANFVTLDAEQAVLWLKHPNGDEHTETFTMADAKAAQLLSSGMYGKFPKAMLRSRAITAGLKSIGWEGGVGMYDPDELPTPTPRTDHSDDAEETEDADVVDAISDAQHDLLTNLLKSHVFTDTERGRVWAAAATKDGATKGIDWAQKQIAKRKASEKGKTIATDGEGLPQATDGDAVLRDESLRAAAKRGAQMQDGYEEQAA